MTAVPVVTSVSDTKDDMMLKTLLNQAGLLFDTLWVLRLLNVRIVPLRFSKGLTSPPSSGPYAMPTGGFGGNRLPGAEL